MNTKKKILPFLLWCLVCLSLCSLDGFIRPAHCLSPVGWRECGPDLLARQLPDTLLQNIAQMKKRGIRVVLFDIDNTITKSSDYEASIKKLFFKHIWQTCTWSNISGRFAKAAVMLFERRFLHKKLTTMEICDKLHIPRREFIRIMNDTIRPAEYFRKDERGIALLKALRENGFQLGVVTDSPKMHGCEKLSALGLTGYFDFLIYGNEHVQKPGSFSYALRVSHVFPSRMIMIGDHNEKDIEGARSHGMYAVKIDTCPDDLFAVWDILDPLFDEQSGFERSEIARRTINASH